MANLYLDADEFFLGKKVRVVITDNGSTRYSGTKSIGLLNVNIFVNSVSKINFTIDNTEWVQKVINLGNETLEFRVFARDRYIDVADKDTALNVSLQLCDWNARTATYDLVGAAYYVDDVSLVDKTKGGSTIVTTPKGTGASTDLRPKTKTPAMSYVGNSQGWAFYKSATNDRYEWRKDKEVETYTTLQTAIEAFVISGKNEDGKDLEGVRKDVGVAVDFQTDLTQYEHQKAMREKFEKLAKDESEYQLYLLNLVKTAIGEMNASSKRKVTNAMRRAGKKPKKVKKHDTVTV